MDRAIPYTAPYPALIGYHPGRNALIAMATDTRGQITGGQFIHLDRGSTVSPDTGSVRIINELAFQCLQRFGNGVGRRADLAEPDRPDPRP